MKRWILRSLLGLVLAALFVGVWKWEEINRLLAVNSLFSEEKIVGNFSDMQGAFLTRTLSRGDAPASPLPVGDTFTLPIEVEKWIAERDVTALVILKDGELVFEEYFLGTTPDDLRMGWSVSKSFLSALFGILVAEGTIPDLDAAVTQYVPELADGAYARASIRDVLQMSSGIVFDEDYLDQRSDINRMGRVLALGGSMDGFATALTETFAEPGTDWQYVSIDTHVIAMVARAATGRTLSELMEEKLIAPLGFEAAPYYITDGYGVAFALGGMNARTRDYARFGQMIAQGGAWQGEQIVPEDWIAESTVPSAPTDPDQTGYGYQWWIPLDGEPGQFMARGIYGQYVWIDRLRNVVIATNAADRAFREPGVARQNEDIFRLIARSL